MGTAPSPKPASPPALADADDEGLLAALLAGDSRAPRALWRRFAPMVFRILRRMLGSRDEIEDIAQDVFLCLYQKAPRVRNPRALKAFVIGTTVFRARYEIRRVSKRRELAALAWTPPPESETLTGAVDARVAVLRFYRIVDGLRRRDREAFVLRVVEEMELTEVAAVLDVSLATIKRRLARAWAKVLLLVERDPCLSGYAARYLMATSSMSKTRGPAGAPGTDGVSP